MPFVNVSVEELSFYYILRYVSATFMHILVSSRSLLCGTQKYCALLFLNKVTILSYDSCQFRFFPHVVQSCDLIKVC